MPFPRLVFKCPGAHQCQGGTFSHAGVADQGEFDQRIAEGWFATLPEALAGKQAKVETKVYADGANATGTSPLPNLSPAEQNAIDNVAIDNVVPTRDEMKQKATELGLVFHGNISNAKLAEMIEAALVNKG